jgi:hypothetical protein
MITSAAANAPVALGGGPSVALQSGSEERILAKAIGLPPRAAASILTGRFR